MSRRRWKPSSLRDALHRTVVEEDLRRDSPETFGAADFEELAHEQGTDAPALEAVADEDRELASWRRRCGGSGGIRP